MKKPMIPLTLDFKTMYVAIGAVHAQQGLKISPRNCMV